MEEILQSCGFAIVSLSQNKLLFEFAEEDRGSGQEPEKRVAAAAAIYIRCIVHIAREEKERRRERERGGGGAKAADACRERGLVFVYMKLCVLRT